MRTNAYIKPKDGDRTVLVTYNDHTRVGLLRDGAFYKDVEIIMGGESWERFKKVWDEFYQGRTAEYVLSDLLRKGINAEYMDVCIGAGRE